MEIIIEVLAVFGLIGILAVIYWPVNSAPTSFYGQDVAARAVQNESYRITLEDANDYLESNGGGN